MLRRAVFQWRRSSSASLANEMVLERLDGADTGIAVMTFNRPKAMNSLSRNMVQQLKTAIQDCRVRSPVLRYSYEMITRLV